MSESLLKEMKENFNKSFADFKSENDKTIDAKEAKLQAKALEQDAKVTKIGDHLDKIEADFKKMQLKEATTKELEATQEKIDKYGKAIINYLRGGTELLEPEAKSLILEGKAKLISGDATMGGYLVRPEFEAIIQKNVTEMDQMYQNARVTNINSRSLIYPKRATLLVAKWVGEQGTTPKVASTYGQGEIVAHGLGACIPITDELLQDSSVAMETEMSMDASEAFAKASNKAFTDGNNVTQPEGVLTNASVSRVDTATSGVFVADDLYTLQFALISDYVNGAKFFGNRQQLARIRKFKGTDGQYLLSTGQFAGIAYTLLGAEWAQMPSMVSSVASSDEIIIYGDMKKAYRIVERTGLSVLRDPYSQKLDNFVEFLFKKRVGGQVTLPEAIKVLRVKA